MRHFTAPNFWKHYAKLPKDIRRLADKNFDLLKRDPNHPSLHFKQIGHFWSVRAGLEHRALAVDGPEGPVWFWTGPHDEYDKLLKIG
jgi:hypothetical protein